MKEQKASIQSKNGISYQKGVLRRKFLERTLVFLFGFGMLAYPASLIRMYQFGWLPIYYFHSIAFISFCVMAIIRKRLSNRTLMIYEITIFGLLGIAGLLQFGLTAAGLSFFFTAVLIVSVTLGIKKGVISLGLSVLLIAFMAYLFTEGLVQLSFDANEYMRSNYAWLNSITAYLLTTGICLISIIGYLQDLSELIDTVEKQRQEIEHLANYDALTNLLTYRNFPSRLQIYTSQADRTKQKVAVLFIDLDQFKQVNDKFGHEAGDIALKCAANRILCALRVGDSALRLGGDEFLVLLPAIGNLKDVEYICQRIIDSITEEMFIENETVYLGASIGVALYPDHGSDADSLRKKADKMMYTVKTSEKNDYLIAPD